MTLEMKEFSIKIKIPIKDLFTEFSDWLGKNPNVLTRGFWDTIRKYPGVK